MKTLILFLAFYQAIVPHERCDKVRHAGDHASYHYRESFAQRQTSKDNPDPSKCGEWKWDDRGPKGANWSAWTGAHGYRNFREPADAVAYVEKDCPQ